MHEHEHGSVDVENNVAVVIGVFIEDKLFTIEENNDFVEEEEEEEESTKISDEHIIREIDNNKVIDSIDASVK